MSVLVVRDYLYGRPPWADAVRSRDRVYGHDSLIATEGTVLMHWSRNMRLHRRSIQSDSSAARLRVCCLARYLAQVGEGSCRKTAALLHPVDRAAKQAVGQMNLLEVEAEAGRVRTQQQNVEDAREWAGYRALSRCAPIPGQGRAVAAGVSMCCGLSGLRRGRRRGLC